MCFIWYAVRYSVAMKFAICHAVVFQSFHVKVLCIFYFNGEMFCEVRIFFFIELERATNTLYSQIAGTYQMTV